MSQLRGGYKAVSVLVEVTQTFDEVVRRVGGAGLADRLIDRQENLEADALVGLVLMSELLHVRFGRILPQSA